MREPCCRPWPSFPLLQVNVICLLLFLIGTTVVVRHPAWFGGAPIAARSLAER